MRWRIGLGLIFLVGIGWSSVTTAAALSPPTFPVKASPNSLASFPCPRKPVSTLAIEACEARKLLRVDRAFNRQASVLWSVLDTLGRGAFVRAHAAWLTYRDQECRFEARAFLGGTLAGLEGGLCQTRLTAVWLHEVKGAVADYCQGKVRTGRYRKCPHS